jgi:hypothetical protein
MRPAYRGHLAIAFAIFAVASSIRVANATALTNPAPLDRGKTVTPIPDGYSGTNFISFQPSNSIFPSRGGLRASYTNTSISIPLHPMPPTLTGVAIILVSK